MITFDPAPIRDAVESVIARHERYVEYTKRKADRHKMREVQKTAAIANAILEFNQSLSAATWWEQICMWPAMTTTVNAIKHQPAKFFCMDRPEIDPRRVQLSRRRHKLVTIRGIGLNEQLYAESLVDMINKEMSSGVLLS